ncbi:MAG: squalene synthase HpnC [Acidimicrobiales bacterium]
MGRVSGENFPVALRVLPASIRGHLLAIYGFARLVDQLGDEAPGDRLAHLSWLEGELDRAYAGRALHPVMVQLAMTLDELDLPRKPFCDLIEANRRDQVVTRYDSWEDLVDYCRYSANPVGRLVLGVFGVSTPERERLSDQVCTGLQVVEHTQDIAQDAGRGRVYLPAQEMARFGCGLDDLQGPSAGPALRAAVAMQCARARALLGAGESLAGSLSGMARLAIAGFTAGGQAALDSIERADFDVLAVQCSPTRRDVFVHAASILSKARRRGVGVWL